LKKIPDKLLYLFAKHGRSTNERTKKTTKGLKKLNPSSEAPITLIFFMLRQINFNANFKNIEDRFVHKWKQKRIMPRSLIP
jgi:adenosine deaminase